MSSEPSGTLRILLAEDDALISMFLAEILTAMGHEVCAIEDTEAGVVGAAARCLPGMMIIDAHLGAGSGVAAVVEVLRSGYVPHLFISGGPVRGASADAVVLEKPFWEADLIRAMARALGQPHAQPPP